MREKGTEKLYLDPTIVRLQRHALKGNGKPVTEDEFDGGPASCISERGKRICRDRGIRLVRKFDAYGGSIESRTYKTAREILSAAGQHRLTELPPDERLGNEALLWKTFGIVKADFVVAVKKFGSNVTALILLCTSEQIEQITNGVIECVIEALEREENTLLLSHSPWVELAVAGILRIIYKGGTLPELGYVDIMLEDENPKIVGTNVPWVAKQLGLECQK